MYEQYIEKFFAEENVSEKDTYETLFNKLEDYNVHILDWNEDNLEEFIISLSSISVNSLNKTIQYLRDFYKFVCKQEDTTPKDLKVKKELKDCIDFEELKRRTIDQKDYKTLRELLIIQNDGYRYNFRDACILVLAWSAHCTNTEIKNLMKSDIKFYTLAGREVCRINLKNRFEIIEDKEEIDIIKRTIIEEHYYMSENARKKNHFLILKSSPALIRPVGTRPSEGNTVVNPSEILKKQLIKLGTIPGTNIFAGDISLEDIVRSKKIMLLKRKDITTNDIKNISGKSSECDLYWLQSCAITIQREEKRKMI